MTDKGVAEDDGDGTYRQTAKKGELLEVKLTNATYVAASTVKSSPIRSSKLNTGWLMLEEKEQNEHHASATVRLNCFYTRLTDAVRASRADV